MSVVREIAVVVRKHDWRIWFGLVVTIFWIAGGIWYVAEAMRQNPDQSLSLDIVGSFLEGAFAPLAFLWLVLGLFIQQRELARHADELRRSSEQSEKQTQAIAATEMNARQETFFKIADNVKIQLGGISGMLFMSGLGPAGSGRYERDEMNDMFSVWGTRGTFPVPYARRPGPADPRPSHAPPRAQRGQTNSNGA